MTVICPNCNARFRDPPAEIPLCQPLQCSKCEHEWVRADAENETIIIAEAPSIAPDMDDLTGESEIRTALPVIMPQEPEKKKREPIYVDRLEPAQAKKRNKFILPMLAVLLTGGIAGSVALKDTIIEAVPASKQLYALAGLKTATSGLEIAGVTTTKTRQDGIKQLIVRGSVENTAHTTVDVPPIRLIMRGESNAQLYAWTVSAAKPKLKAGEKANFTAVAHNYPGNAVDVEVVFDAPEKN